MELFLKEHSPAAMAEFIRSNKTTSLREARDCSTDQKVKRVAMIEAARNITTMMWYEVMVATEVGGKEDPHNQFSVTPEAHKFWMDRAAQSDDAVWEEWVKLHPKEQP